jgi:ubiquinone/menaquinone biosynthesis C-methylase UbiE
MGFKGALVRHYFNLVYNPVYDFTTGRLNRYQKLQIECLSKLKLEDNDRVLCVGLGTGNEITRIFEINKNIELTGLDYSGAALKKARQKALKQGKNIKTINLDVQKLGTVEDRFDKVFCMHVIDFVEDPRQATQAMLAVLKQNGSFVITYPSGKEGMGLGAGLLSDNVHHGVSHGKNRILSYAETFGRLIVGLVYLPLLFRPKRKAYSRNELEAMIAELTVKEFYIEEDSIYRDYIVRGTKKE